MIAQPSFFMSAERRRSPIRIFSIFFMMPFGFLRALLLCCEFNILLILHGRINLPFIRILYKKRINPAILCVNLLKNEA